MKKKNNYSMNINDSQTNLINKTFNNNKRPLLEILACEETLKDFEEYLLEKGFNDMMLCITSAKHEERKQFNKFFEYFGIETKSQELKQQFIRNLSTHLNDIRGNESKTETKNQSLAIIAVALQNCKLREQFYPENCEAKNFSTNLLPLLSQAQYFLRFAENCNASFSTMNIFDKKKKKKKINIIDTNNFLYSNSQMMPVHKSGTIEKNCKKHFKKISQTIAEKSQQQKQQYNVKIINIVPTSHYWGTQQNPHIIEAYNTISNGNKDIEYRMLFNIDKKDLTNQYIYNDETKAKIRKMTNDNIQIQLYDGKKRKQTPFPENDKNIAVNYLNSGDHLVFPPNEGFIYFSNQPPKSGSMDVAMTRTDFFTRLGADGHLGKNGVFTFNNTKSKQENFQSLRMPNIFLFKGKTIDAQQFITNLGIMPKIEKPKQQPPVNPQGIDNNGACESLKQTCPCLKKCF